MATGRRPWSASGRGCTKCDSAGGVPVAMPLTCQKMIAVAQQMNTPPRPPSSSPCPEAYPLRVSSVGGYSGCPSYLLEHESGSQAYAPPSFLPLSRGLPSVRVSSVGGNSGCPSHLLERESGSQAYAPPSSLPLSRGLPRVCVRSALQLKWSTPHFQKMKAVARRKPPLPPSSCPEAHPVCV